MNVAAAAREELWLFGVALQFLTRFPLPHWLTPPSWEPLRLNRSVRYFPLVGALVGASAAVVALIAMAVWPPLVAATLSVTFTLWLTVAFHEDGLADCADALLGAASRERALTIMKDSRIGSYGAAVLGVSLLLRIVLFAAVLGFQPLLAGAACVAVHAIARGGAVALMGMLPYGGDTEHARVKPLAHDVQRADVLYALAWASVALLPVMLLAPEGIHAALMVGVFAILGVTLLVGMMRNRLTRRLGGYTGDTLGACEQLAEIVLWLVFAGAWGS